MANLSADDRLRMQQLVERDATVSDKIRTLAAAGFKRADIARFLGKRYQHVRNVLVQDEQKASAKSGRVSNSEPDTGDSAEPVWVKLGEGGRIVIPVGLRKALGVKEGADLHLALEGRSLVLRTREGAFRQVQKIVRQYVPGDTDLVRELLDERREEASRERRSG